MLPLSVPLTAGVLLSEHTDLLHTVCNLNLTAYLCCYVFRVLR